MLAQSFTSQTTQDEKKNATAAITVTEKTENSTSSYLSAGSAISSLHEANSNHLLAFQAKMDQSESLPASSRYQASNRARNALEVDRSAARLNGLGRSLQDEMIYSKILQNGQVPDQLMRNSSNPEMEGSMRSIASRSNASLRDDPNVLREELIESKLLQSGPVPKHCRSNSSIRTLEKSIHLSATSDNSSFTGMIDSQSLREELIHSKILQNDQVPEFLLQDGSRSIAVADKNELNPKECSMRSILSSYLHNNSFGSNHQTNKIEESDQEQEVMSSVPQESLPEQELNMRSDQPFATSLSNRAVRPDQESAYSNKSPERPPDTANQAADDKSAR